jgi:catechol 2,3-dioxygenase-like lactoylglutathione lyase family enzyme
VDPLVNQARRTTIVTHSIAESLKLYRDTLGMTVWFDGEVDEPQQCDAYDLPPGTKVRVCILAGNSHSQDDTLVTGMVGLMEFLGVEMEPPAQPTRRPQVGQTLIIFDTTKIQEIERRMNAGGFHLVTPLAEIQVPGRKIVYELLAYDPNGARISFAQNCELEEG